jgi:hypothetical protein
MPTISKFFIVTGILCVLAGMAWGMQMAASGNHGMMPAHAHLNLLGFVTLTLMGLFYWLRGSAGLLAWINYWLSTVSVLVMIPMLAYLLADEPARGPTIGPLMTIPEIGAVLGMAIFLYNVVTTKSAAKV